MRNKEGKERARKKEGRKESEKEKEIERERRKKKESEIEKTHPTIFDFNIIKHAHRC